MHAIATLVNASEGEKSFATIAAKVPDLRILHSERPRLHPQ